LNISLADTLTLAPLIFSITLITPFSLLLIRCAITPLITLAASRLLASADYAAIAAIFADISFDFSRFLRHYFAIATFLRHYFR
jgi:hypothetical protein